MPDSLAMCAKNHSLSLVLDNISGGRISTEEIDTIRKYPQATEITISGLRQDTFDYFLSTYASQFKAIHFWKCPLVNDLRMIESLPAVEHITYYWNQRAEALWDFRKTPALRSLRFEDFTRMHDLSQISEARSLEELDFGNKIWRTYVVDSLEPLRACTGLKKLYFSVKKIVDNRIEPLAALENLEALDFPSNQFSTEQIAWLKVHLPPTVQSNVLQPFWKTDRSFHISGKNKDTFIVGKRKPFLDSVLDKKRVERYVENFNRMCRWFEENLDAAPEDYPGK